tara:strand:+ start:12033 stop:13091 length:1059 start_codon:yes stop_codon:yes gene_type:complete
MINKYDKIDRSDEQLASYSRKVRMGKHVDKILDTSGELPAEEYSNVYKSLLQKRLDFINGDKQQRSLIKRDVNQMKEAIVSYRTFRQDLAAAYKTGSLMNTWIDGEQGEAVMNLLDDVPRLVQKKYPEGLNGPNKNEIGVIMPDFKAVNDAMKRVVELDSKKNQLTSNSESKKQYDEAMSSLKKIIDNQAMRWVDISNLNKMIMLKDEDSKEVLSKMGNNYLRSSSNQNEVEDMPFNELAARRQVEGTLISKASNLQSLAYDEMIPGRTFFNDVKEKIKMTTQFKTDEQADRVAKFMVNDPAHKKEFKAELTDYFTRFLKKQHDIGKLNRRKVIKKKDKKFSGIKKYRPGTL